MEVTEVKNVIAMQGKHYLPYKQMHHNHCCYLLLAHSIVTATIKSNDHLTQTSSTTQYTLSAMIINSASLSMRVLYIYDLEIMTTCMYNNKNL